MAEITKELLEKLMPAASPEEAAELLKAEGITDEPMDKVWQGLEELRSRELSLDELDDVAGGWDYPKRNWLTDGCANTVKAYSYCMYADLGGVDYGGIYPNASCPKCGQDAYYNNDNTGICRECGRVNPWVTPIGRGGASGSW